MENIKNTHQQKSLFWQQIQVVYPFYSFYPMSGQYISHLSYLLKEQGFKHQLPVSVWKNNCILLSGHDRYFAAKKAGIVEIPVAFYEFSTSEQALFFALNQQKNEQKGNYDSQILYSLDRLQMSQQSLQKHYQLYQDRVLFYEQLSHLQEWEKESIFLGKKQRPYQYHQKYQNAVNA